MPTCALFRTRAAALVLILTRTGSAPALPPATSPEVVDSGRDATVRAAPGWVDATRLVFVGLEPEYADYPVPNPPRHIYVWHVDRGEVVRHAEGRRLCVAPGRVRYLSKVVEGRDASGAYYRYSVLREGPLGAERRALRIGEGTPPVDLSLVEPSPAHHNRHDCDAEARSRPVRGREVVPLKRAHGRFELTAPGGTPLHRTLERKVVFIGTDGRRRSVAMPASIAEDFLWLDREQRYFAYRFGCRGDRPPAAGLTTFRFDPVDARVDERCLRIPTGPLRDARFRVHPVRNGYLAVVTEHVRRRGHLFFVSVDADRTIEIARGYVPSVAVSPDGCRVAFSHGPFYGASPSNRIFMKLVDVCRPITDLSHEATPGS